MQGSQSKYFTLCYAIILLIQNNLIYAQSQQTLPTSNSKPIPKLSETQNMDTVLSEKVQSVITKISILKGQAVTAASRNQIITLEGSVENKQQEKAAIKAAKSVKGVKEVKSQLTIKFISK